ncbi:hypothetical protein MKW94_000361, partial [Papaver nudicaule]|nr:hypothetical protein [Papaver nudicaule]
VVIRNAKVRGGVLMLVPEGLSVLGGMVEDLEAARKKAVEEVNEPPRGKRYVWGCLCSWLAIISDADRSKLSFASTIE